MTMTSRRRATLDMTVFPLGVSGGDDAPAMGGLFSPPSMAQLPPGLLNA